MFERFPSLTRFSQDWTVTEKIDGTNAQILITEDGQVLAGSRTRLITPDDDNYGFARWVKEHEEGLKETLGEGRHFGEWWGKGIQRGYSLTEKRFSLFNTSRWKKKDLPDYLHVVPTLCEGEYFDSPGSAFAGFMKKLKKEGSLAAPGYMNPEGIVIRHGRSGTMFKKTFDYDEFGKWKEMLERKENEA